MALSFPFQPKDLILIFAALSISGSTLNVEFVQLRQGHCPFSVSQDLHLTTCTMSSNQQARTAATLSGTQEKVMDQVATPCPRTTQMLTPKSFLATNNNRGPCSPGQSSCHGHCLVCVETDMEACSWEVSLRRCSSKLTSTPKALAELCASATEVSISRQDSWGLGMKMPLQAVLAETHRKTGSPVLPIPVRNLMRHLVWKRKKWIQKAES